MRGSDERTVMEGWTQSSLQWAEERKWRKSVIDFSWTFCVEGKRNGVVAEGEVSQGISEGCIGTSQTPPQMSSVGVLCH